MPPSRSGIQRTNLYRKLRAAAAVTYGRTYRPRRRLARRSLGLVTRRIRPAGFIPLGRLVYSERLDQTQRSVKTDGPMGSQ